MKRVEEVKGNQCQLITPSHGFIGRLVSRQEVRAVFNPLFQLQFFTAQDLADNTECRQQVTKGVLKKRVRALLRVHSLSEVRLPLEKVLAECNQRFEVIMVVTHTLAPTTIEFFFKHLHYVKSSSLDGQLKQVIFTIAGGAENIADFQINKKTGRASDSSIRTQLLAATQYRPGNVFININTVESCANYEVILDDKGSVINVDKFIDDTLKILANVMLFCQDPQIRYLQGTGSIVDKTRIVRLMDHRPLLYSLWNEAIQFSLGVCKSIKLKVRFTNEQIGITYATHYSQIMEKFNRFVLGGDFIVQPHPVRALLDSMDMLTEVGCFDIGYYDLRQYGLNLCSFSYYLGKNMLSCDESMSNNEGCCALIGTQGSGKSRISIIIDQFMNGYRFMDTKEGIFEFQNYDIVTKSFIRADEVPGCRLGSTSWKQLADIEAAVKCRIKNKQDVEVKKNVTVIATGNYNVYTELLEPAAQGNMNLAAACRRWGFIRYFETWNFAHNQLLGNTGLLLPQYRGVYQHNRVNHELFNTLIAIALLFPNTDFVVTPYNVGYYKHCLLSFAATVFGYTFFLNHAQFIASIEMLNQSYNTTTDYNCAQIQQKLAKRLEVLITEAILRLGATLHNGGWVNYTASNESDPFYIRVFKIFSGNISTMHTLQETLRKQSTHTVRQLLVQYPSVGLYRAILEELDPEEQQDVHQPDLQQLEVHEEEQEEMEEAESIPEERRWDNWEMVIDGREDLGSLFGDTSLNRC